MYLLDLLSTAGGLEKRWFILFQDYLFYALLFVSGPVGLFVNMWSGETLTCIPVLNCTANPRGSVHCLKDKADEVWQQLLLPLTTHLSDVCMENHTLPSYVLYAYVPVFGGAVVAWVLHNLWLKVPPYARIARLYGNLDKAQRDEVKSALYHAVNQKPERLSSALGFKDKSGDPDLLKTEEEKVRELADTWVKAAEAGQVGKQRNTEKLLIKAIQTKHNKYALVRPGDRPNEPQNVQVEEPLIPLSTDDGSRDAFVKSLVALLYRKGAPKLHRVFQYLNFFTLLLLLTGGILIITHVLTPLDAPFPCIVGERNVYFLSVNYTSIRCSLHNEMGARTQYWLCTVLSLLIVVLKLLMAFCAFYKMCIGTSMKHATGYAFCSNGTLNLCLGACCGATCCGEECNQSIEADVHMLHLLLDENTTCNISSQVDGNLNRCILKMTSDKRNAIDGYLTHQFVVYVKGHVIDYFNQHYVNPIGAFLQAEEDPPVVVTASILPFTE